ncbi:hypothetical protein HHI36_004358 [Cryptolaemus montrouzieri]|uniref:Uncharacterized protein n=1 Tax=Cryptolaemus montrouzieri TaxID=559131 RepID=A0ABD2NQX4_9CUCU
MGEFSDKQKKYLKDLLGDLNSSLNNKIQQLETSITAKLEDVRSEFEEKVGKGAKKPVIVELISYRKKCQILKGANKLKGTSIFLSPDLSPEERAQHKMLVNHMNEARNRGKQAKIQGRTLIIEGQTITIQQLEKQKTADKPKNFSENLIHPCNKEKRAQ